jgi:phosphoglycolate phosphatase-like HAD superfamily hydrolase
MISVSRSETNTLPTSTEFASAAKMRPMFSITPQHDFLVGIDSDGCVFDSMEIKHKECFIPTFIRHYGLQGVSRFAREAAEFVNLYSKSRGINRFPALLEQLDWLARRAAVVGRGVNVPRPQGLIDWVARESKLGNPALEKAVTESGDEDLKKALAWSVAVNKAIADMVRDVPPFPYVRECLERFDARADMIVCSQTPCAALEAEWKEHDLAKYVVAICGQEVASKKESLGQAAKYPPNHTLMIGDAPGDFKAAAANKCLFFPINPGAEEHSWRRLYDEGIARFFDGSFAGVYQQQLLEQFDAFLPEHPPWKVEV